MAFTLTDQDIKSATVSKEKFVPPEPGVFTIKFKMFEFTESRSGNSMCKVKLEVAEGPHAGLTTNDYFIFDQKFKWKFGLLSKSLSLPAGLDWQKEETWVENVLLKTTQANLSWTPREFKGKDGEMRTAYDCNVRYVIEEEDIEEHAAANVAEDNSIPF